MQEQPPSKVEVVLPNDLGDLVSTSSDFDPETDEWGYQLEED